ncbi:hypothetical protein PIIN_10433 [Serendipita indica DSM 11827]|uniref:Uncharacterized protein n=1 Tax=Serendipita indica (strain DSM 11827) TaxID=1109443 RepID=G4TYP7_SERID|nr:hypothetical protein PIIN_10433 [Serendipita indica DSM 11827]
MERMIRQHLVIGSLAYLEENIRLPVPDVKSPDITMGCSLEDEAAQWRERQDVSELSVIAPEILSSRWRTYFTLPP